MINSHTVNAQNRTTIRVIGEKASLAASNINSTIRNYPPCLMPTDYTQKI